MLPLDSPRWSQLSAAGGSPLLVPQLIRRLGSSPTPSDWAEIWEQVSHQWTGSPVGFAALPHLIQLGIEQGLFTTVDFLLGLGRTVDALATLGPPPADLQGDYEASLRQAAPLVAQAARTPAYLPDDYVCVLHAAAALSGRTGLGTDLFFALVASSPELDCPACAGYLCGEFEDDGLIFQSVSSTMKPLSKPARARPAQPDANESLAWLAEQCRAARQEEILGKICCLYGTVICPLCDSELVVMDEIQRAEESEADD